MLCLSPDKLAGVRADPRKAIPALYESCASEVDQKLGPLDLTAEEERIAFLSVLAHSLAPYGASRSLKLEDLLADTSMDCDNYAILTGYFNDLFAGRTSKLKFAGFDGGAVGNHAQLFVNTEKGLLLDPTIGLVARIGFDDLLQGKPLNRSQIVIFRQHEQPDLDFFVNKVYDAILLGKYKPRDILYYFDSIQEYMKFSERIGPLWGKEVDELLLHFPTPRPALCEETLIRKVRIKGGVPADLYAPPRWPARRFMHSWISQTGIVAGQGLSSNGSSPPRGR